jgi:hypothetical protein
MTRFGVNTPFSYAASVMTTLVFFPSFSTKKKVRGHS